MELFVTFNIEATLNKSKICFCFFNEDFIMTASELSVAIGF